MRVAALYDVHAMPWALEAVLAEVEREGIDAIVFGGDLLGGPCENETLALARSVEATWVRGNVEDAYEWGREFPLTVELDGVTYCQRAIAGVRASGWGGGEEFVAENLLVAVSREEAIAHFEAQR